MTHPIVVVDTDIFSALYTDPERAARRGLPVEEWRTALEGRRVVISFQTRAEVLAGVLASNWSAPRIDAQIANLNSAHTISADLQVIDTFAELTAECMRIGHALHQKIHTGDRWVAASAIAKRLPLLSRIYAGAPGLELLS